MCVSVCDVPVCVCVYKSNQLSVSHVCECVCVCVSVYLPENEDLVPHSYIQTADAPPNIGRPRIGELVQMVANSTCIHMRMC